MVVSPTDRKSTRLNSSHLGISYAVFCLKKIKDDGALLLTALDRWVHAVTWVGSTCMSHCLGPLNPSGHSSRVAHFAVFFLMAPGAPEFPPLPPEASLPV